MKCNKRILPCFLAFVTIFLWVVPVKAHAESSSPMRTDFLTWITDQANAGTNWWKHLLLDSDVCPKSPKTNGLHEFVKMNTTVNGIDGAFWVCKYCGKSSGEVGKTAFDDYVKNVGDTLGTTEIGKSGYYMYLECFDLEPVSPSITAYAGGFSKDTHTVSCTFRATGAMKISMRFYVKAVAAPVAGYYSFGQRTTSVVNCDPLSQWGPSIKKPGDLVLGSLKSDGTYSPAVITVSCGTYKNEARFTTTPYLYVEPLAYSVNDYTDPIGGSDSRPSNITGNYGIIGDNGTISNITNNTIVNETNNTFTNPSTGETYEITNWSYDYSDRSYNLTLSTGDTVTVTYGDENITINQGDTIYNVYYIIQGSDVTPACQHDYQSTVTVEATCEAAGQLTYTCSKCGDSYTKAVPAKGHTWQVKQSVSTEYDDSGNVTQQGYTIYKCSVCGNEYKDEAGAGPPSKPDSGGDEDTGSLWSKLGSLIGSLLSGLLGMVQAVLGKILDALTSLAALIGEKLQGIVELVLSFFDAIPEMFSGFLGFLGAVFGFLPADILLLLTFGVAAVVFIGIIKALRR